MENYFWGALPTRIFIEKYFPQKQNEIEDPIPPKMKRSDRCDTIFTPPTKIEFFPGQSAIIQVYCDVLLGSTVSVLGQRQTSAWAGIRNSCPMLLKIGEERLY